MRNKIIKVLSSLMVGLFLFFLVLMSANVEADESGDGIEVNGLFWGDGDYGLYQFYSNSEPDGRGYTYVKNAGPNLLNVLVRVDTEVNDNAFSPKNPGQEPYLESVGWKNPHDLGRIIGSDHLEIFMECGSGDSTLRHAWSQDYIYDADEGPDYDWRSDSFGPDGVPVWSPSSSAIPASGIVITSHSSLEYNLENSSWLVSQQSVFPLDYDQWMSPDLDPLGTISMTTSMTDVTTMTGIHEDYPFFTRTGDDPADVYEWALSYEMLLDVSHCNGQPVVVGVNSAHNSPPKDGTEDILIPTYIGLSEFSASARDGSLVPIMIMATLLFVGTIGILVHKFRTSPRSR